MKGSGEQLKSSSSPSTTTAQLPACLGEEAIFSSLPTRPFSRAGTLFLLLQLSLRLSLSRSSISHQPPRGLSQPFIAQDRHRSCPCSSIAVQLQSQRIQHHTCHSPPTNCDLTWSPSLQALLARPTDDGPARHPWDTSGSDLITGVHLRLCRTFLGNARHRHCYLTCNLFIPT